MPKGKIFIATDIQKSSYRLGLQSYYKGNRRKNSTPEEEAEHALFTEAYHTFIELSKHLNAVVLDIEGVEADDQASIIAEAYAQQGYDVTLVTADRDWLQSLLDVDTVRLYDPTQRKFYYRKDVIEEYGVTSRSQFCVLKACAGDAGDNIVAFKNVGPARGKKLFNMIFDKYEEPTLEHIVLEGEQFIEENPKFAIHPLHLKDGRDTVAEVLESNMLVAETFTSMQHLTESQQQAFDTVRKRVLTPDKEKLFSESLKVLGFPIILSNKAERVLL